MIRLLIMLMLASPAMAARFIEYDNEKRVDVWVGINQANRVYFEGENIKEIIGEQEKFKFIASESGQIFIIPTTKDNINITLITDSGFAQDMQLRVRDRINTVLIKHKEAAIQAPQKTQDHATPFIKALADGLPGGEAVRSSVFKMPKGSRVVSAKKWHHQGMTGFVIKIKNWKKLSEKDFSQILPNIKAISLIGNNLYVVGGSYE